MGNKITDIDSYQQAIGSKQFQNKLRMTILNGYDSVGDWKFKRFTPTGCNYDYGYNTPHCVLKVKNTIDRQNDRADSIYRVFEHDKQADTQALKGFMTHENKLYLVEDEKKAKTLENWDPQSQYDLYQLYQGFPENRQRFEMKNWDTLIFQLEGYNCQQVYKRVDLEALEKLAKAKQQREDNQSKIEEQLEVLDDNLIKIVEAKDRLYTDLQKKMQEMQYGIDELISQQEQLKNLKYETDRQIEELDNRIYEF